MSNDQHREWHYFLLTDYEKEEAFLREKHKNGERLVQVTVTGNYTFEACEPEDVVYRLDFNPQRTEDREEYLQMFADYGWEYVQDLNEYSYFRKSAKDADEADLEIFSDDASRLDMLSRIFYRRMLPILAIFLCVAPQCIRALLGEFTGAFGYILTGILTVFLVFDIWVIIHCGIGFFRLRRKYRDGAE